MFASKEYSRNSQQIVYPVDRLFATSRKSSDWFIVDGIGGYFYNIIMCVAQRLSDIRPTLGIIEYDYMEKYHASFVVIEIGHIRDSYC